MITHIKGILVNIDFSSIVIDVNGIGFFIKISLNTYYKLEGLNKIFLYIHLIFRDDKFQLYGFFNKQERLFFKNLISVNGIGANLSMIILSSLTTEEITDAIVNNKKEIFKSIKGIGDKTAKRILVELQDEIKKNYSNNNFDMSKQNKQLLKNEAIIALFNLGFSSKKKISEVLDILIFKNPSISIGELIKKALMIL